MKKSEQLRLEASMEDSDSKAFGIIKKAKREENLEMFNDNWLNKIKETTEVEENKNGGYDFYSSHGKVSFYPKSDKIHIHSTNSWKRRGLNFIKEQILKR